FLEFDLDVYRGGLLTALGGAVVDDVVRALELRRGLAEERPEHGVEDGRLPEPVFGVDQGDVLFPLDRELQLLQTVELPALLELDPTNSHASPPRRPCPGARGPPPAGSSWRSSTHSHICARSPSVPVGISRSGIQQPWPSSFLVGAPVWPSHQR